MKKLLGTMTVISSLLLILCSPAFSQDASAKRTITVNGDSEIKVDANLAVIKIAISIRDSSLDEARKRMADRISELTSITIKYGVNSEDVQSDYLEISKPRDSSTDKEYYSLSKNITILFKDLTRYEEFISELALADFRTTGKIEYKVLEIRKYKDEARTLALKAALGKASDMALQIGGKIGKAISIVENISKYDAGPNRNPWQQSSNYPNPFNRSFTVDSDYIQSSDNTSPGKVSVTASVTVSFALE